MARGAKRSSDTGVSVPTVTAADENRVLNVHPDMPDLRDRIYEPALLDLQVGFEPPTPEDNVILDQGREGACTGFALAGTINVLRYHRAKRQELVLPTSGVSPRMLYEMARLHDEWPGEDYEGSSIRGAIKGFFHNGVCSDTLAPYKVQEKDWSLTVEQAKDARNTGLGAYYRLRKEIIDYHSALNEVGVIIVSAKVHRGWQNPPKGKIRKSNLHEGGHAFMIVGYDEEGFLIQNSWGPQWGGYRGIPGTAHWSYQDWAENITDAWVLRLAVPTPDAFDLTHLPVDRNTAAGASVKVQPKPRRQDILGHVIHMDDGKLVENGRYPTTLENIKETGSHLVADETGSKKYDHLLFYAHGGLNSSEASARRIVGMKDVFKRNRIYPVHFMWETGFTEEMGDIFKEFFQKGQERVGFAVDFKDWAIEQAARGIGRRLWRQMKLDAERSFRKNAAGWTAVAELLKSNAARTKPLKVHLVGHSAGSILLGEWLKSWRATAGAATDVESLSLMAPACTFDFYDAAYVPALGGNTARIISKLYQYTLVDSRELDDTVGPYGKSLLYFVSNAFEEKKGEKLLGMEKFVKDVGLPNNHKVWFAGRDTSRTDSKSHGGFDNDRHTMNDILANILGKKPKPSDAFQEHEVSGY